MNTFTTNPTAARSVARQLIDERVQDAERRRLARTARAERRASEDTTEGPPTPRPLPWWAFRFLRAAH